MGHQVLKLDQVVQHTKDTLFEKFVDAEPLHKVSKAEGSGYKEWRASPLGGRVLNFSAG